MYGTLLIWNLQLQILDPFQRSITIPLTSVGHFSEVKADSTIIAQYINPLSTAVKLDYNIIFHSECLTTVILLKGLYITLVTVKSLKKRVNRYSSENMSIYDPKKPTEEKLS